MILDTHKLIEELIDTGVKKKTAEVFVRGINEAKDNLATKSDIANLKDIMATKIDVSEAKYDILKAIIPIGLTIILLLVGVLLK